MFDILKSRNLPLSIWHDEYFATLAPTHADDVDVVPTTIQSRKKRLSEQAEDYPHVVATLNYEWRVICCRDRIQWILQRKTGGRWRSIAYCRTRGGLLRCIREAGISSDVIDASELSQLPERL